MTSREVLQAVPSRVADVQNPNNQSKPGEAHRLYSTLQKETVLLTRVCYLIEL